MFHGWHQCDHAGQTRSIAQQTAVHSQQSVSQNLYIIASVANICVLIKCPVCGIGKPEIIKILYSHRTQTFRYKRHFSITDQNAGLNDGWDDRTPPPLFNEPAATELTPPTLTGFNSFPELITYTPAMLAKHVIFLSASVCVCVCVSVCLSVCPSKYSKTTDHRLTQLGENEFWWPLQTTSG